MNSFFDRFGRLHAWAYRRDGRLGRRFAWIPCLVLVTTGRKSGRPIPFVALERSAEH